MKNNKIIAILGPTTSGKSDLAVILAKKFNGEIVSADSRQVYRGLNIGSGKITKSQMQGIPHHLLDVASPKRKFTVAQFQKLALKKICQIQRKNKIPFLVGGSGFYIKSIVDGIKIPGAKPNWKLRKKLEKKSNQELFNILLKIDPERASSIDSKNPRRLIRAIEIIKTTGNPIPKTSLKTPVFKDVFATLQIGIKKSPNELKKAIRQRLNKRLKQGLLTEVKRLHNPPSANSGGGRGLSWKRLEELGLEYRFVAQYLQGKMKMSEQVKKNHSLDNIRYLRTKRNPSPKAKKNDKALIAFGERIIYQNMVKDLNKAIEKFAKRQMTWFKRDKEIRWVNNYKQAENLIKRFL